jgi:very-short-patch-repair endonuclease
LEVPIFPARFITDVTRRRLIAGLGEMRVVWSGVLDDIEFLSRLYDLERLPATDKREQTAAEDIGRHRLAFADWDDDWIYYDERFAFHPEHGDQPLLAFLAEMLHPAVRTDLDEVARLLAFFNAVLIHDGYELVQVEQISGAPVFGARRLGSGVPGTMKNLIFAAVGPKPKIVLDDAVNNELRIVSNEQGCLVYDRPLPSDGLTWEALTAWWADREGMTDAPGEDVARSLYQRLDRSLGKNDAERRILHTYAQRYIRFGTDIPALIPQVYLHYDPYTASRYQRGSAPLQRQRMDFLLLLPHRVRVVIECDGLQHYADSDGRANPRKYAAMMAEDRDLRLRGYEVYRFGGHDLRDTPATARRLDSFFDQLTMRHGR